MRRLFILVMVVALGGLIQLPLSASALLSSHQIGCATPKVRVHCDDMNMGSSNAQLAAAEDTTCCFISGLPAQESSFVVSAPNPVPARTASSVSVSDVPRVRILPQDIARHDFSPPASQSLLCI